MAKLDNKPAPVPEPEKGPETTPETSQEGQNPALPGASGSVAGEDSPPAPEEAPRAPETAPKAPEKPRLPKTERPYLDSPRAFGINYGGLLHSFAKGKTKLKPEIAAWLKDHPYVADNGAEVVE